MQHDGDDDSTAARAQQELGSRLLARIVVDSTESFRRTMRSRDGDTHVTSGRSAGRLERTRLLRVDS